MFRNPGGGDGYGRRGGGGGSGGGPWENGGGGAGGAWGGKYSSSRDRLWLSGSIEEGEVAGKARFIKSVRSITGM